MIPRILRPVKQVLRRALVIALCVSLTGCSSILGDGEISVVTAPPIITPKVMVYDSYGKGNQARFDIGGTEAFYLLPGIEHNPDYLQDFNCLDYTDDGYFVYYYCAPAYISQDDVKAYAGMKGTAPEEPYRDRNTNSKALCDAMIVMAYHPVTREFIVMDAQAYSNETANSQTGGEANTGVDFYASSVFGFYTLSHCYGCKLYGVHRYYIFDQAGNVSVYDQTFKLLSRTVVGGLIMAKVEEVAGDLNAKVKKGSTAKEAAKSSRPDQVSDDEAEDELGDGDEDEIEEAKKEVEEATGETFDDGSVEEDEEISLNCLVKSAVMDGGNVMYLTVMLYTGESPWVSEILYNRVIQIYSFDLSGDQLKFISANENHEKQVELYKTSAGSVSMADIKEGKTQAPKDSFTPFDSDSESFPAYIAGYGDLTADGCRGFIALANASANNGKDMNLAAAAVARQLVKGMDNDWSFWRWLHEDGYNIAKKVVENSGYTNDELDAVTEFFYSTDTLREFSWSEEGRIASALDGDNVTQVLLSTFLNSTNLNDSIRDPSKQVEVRKRWDAMPAKIQAVFYQGLGGYINRLASGYRQGGQNVLWLNSWNWYWNYSSILLWSNVWGARRNQNKDYTGSYADYQEFLRIFSLVPAMGDYDRTTGRNLSLFPRAEGGSELQALLLIHGTNAEFSDKVSLPRTSVITQPSGDNVWVEPDKWNEEIQIYTKGGWKVDEEAAATLWDEIMELTPERQISIEELLKYEEEHSKDEALSELTGYVRQFSGVLLPEGKATDEAITEFAYVMYQAAHGEVREPIQLDTERSIPANTYPVSYRLRFPKGTLVQFVDMQDAEGSSNTSVRTGALLFSDDAKDTKAGLEFTANIRWQREEGVSFSDSKVPGAAIDTGALNIGNNMTLMLITEQGVKFYPLNANGTASDRVHYMTNEQLLSSTGFTPYTEAGTQGALNERLDDLEGLPEEKYKDKNQVTVTQEQLAKTLNSSRVGTIQAATSFTMLSDTEVLISAYDSGLSLLRLNDTHDVLHLQDGSYYQSFLDGKTGSYKVVGYDTEDYLYGSMDLARARVYDFDAKNRKTEIYLTAIEKHLDQLAVDHVRRLHRTRVEYDEDADGNIIKKETVIVPFENDASEEAASERLLFAGGEAEAMAELSRMETAATISHTEASKEYLRVLRKRVQDQQKALTEVFEITGAKDLGSLTDTDPYWVGIKERLQATTELGDLKDILAEIVTSEDMLSTMKADEAQTYREYREKLNYKEESKAQDEALAQVDLTAEELTELLENRKTPKDFEEKYEELSRGTVEEPDPLTEALNTERLREDTKENTADRSQIRKYVLWDVENRYLEAHPLPKEKIYAADGSYEERVTEEKEDLVWDKYLSDLLYRINPNNLEAARAVAAEEFAELTYTSARTMSSGLITDEPLEVSDDMKKKMKEAVLTGLDSCETLYQVEALFFGTQAKYLGNPYGQYKSAVESWEAQESADEAEKAKAMRASDWYKKMKQWFTNDAQIKAMLASKGQTWEEYISSVVTHRTGRVLRDEQTGEAAGANTSAASIFAQLVEFLCEGAGEVSQETKINMVEDLLLGMYAISGARSAEEAVLIERMTLPAYSSYMSAYTEFNSRNFDDNTGESGDGDGTESFSLSSGASLRQQAYKEQDFYRDLIVTMQESKLVKAYLATMDQTWDQYMASLPILAQNEGIADPAASARKVYETFEPFVPADTEVTDVSDGSEERPTIDNVTG